MSFEVKMPEMGEGIIEATVVNWLKQEGDLINQDEPLAELETDKVTTEIVAETSGTVLKLLVAVGTAVEVGHPIAIIGQAGEIVHQNGNGHMPEPAIALPTPLVAVTASATQTEVEKPPRLSPVVAQMVKLHDVDVSQISGTGRNGRVTKKDVERYLAQEVKVESEITPAPSTPTEVVPNQINAQPKPSLDLSQTETLAPLSRMRQAIAAHMVHSKQTSPHVTTIFEADFSTVMAHRRAHKPEFAQKGIHLTLTPYIVQAVAQALREYPNVNSSWRDQGLILKQQINIGLAVAIPDGLIVPVLKQADELNLTGLARQVNDLAERARTNQLQPDEVNGGTFTITNHGVSGSLFATPIINQPQCGILGVGKIEKRVVVIEDKANDLIAIRPMAYLSFTFDHRILDGATADHFVASVKEMLENWA